MLAKVRLLWVGVFIFGVTSCGGNFQSLVQSSLPATTLNESARSWVDQTLISLSDEALAGQLIIQWIPGGYAAESSAAFAALEDWVVEGEIGGVSPSIGTPHAYAAKLNALQERARVPLLVTSDFENGGPGMRLSGTYALPSMLPQGGGTDFPPTMAFGAIDDIRFAYEYGRITAIEARASGVHVLFAPVLDVNSNPENPVIATRSFGADPERVADLGAAFIRGAKSGGVFTTGKHFPGHGDTGTDSHLGLAVVEADRQRLDQLELIPFVRAIEEGVDAIMTAHVEVPQLLGIGAPPATLSRELLTGLLRDELGFGGLLFTDAMTMRAITDMYGAGEAVVRAIEAGADVILSPADVKDAIVAVLEAMDSGRLTRARLEQSVRRILEFKARLGLHTERLVELDQVTKVVGSAEHQAFADSAASRSITLIRDRANLLPLSRLIGGPTVHVRYAPASMLWASRGFSQGLRERVPDLTELIFDERSELGDYLKAGDVLEGAARVIITAYVSASSGSGRQVLPGQFSGLISRHADPSRTVLTSFGNPYLLSALPDIGTYVLAWGNREVSQRAAVRALFGEEDISGRLPLPLPPFHDLGDGLDRIKVAERLVSVNIEDPLQAAGILDRVDMSGGSESQQTLADPVEVGMSSEGLARVDAIIEAAIADSAASAAALAIGRYGKLVSLRGFGDLAYGSGREVLPTSIFDLASVSKVVGTTTAVMILVAEGVLDLDAPVANYLSWWARGDDRKREVTVRQLLLHRAGLAPFRQWFFELEGVSAYQDAVADEPLEEDPGVATVYSDIGVMTLAWVVEELVGQRLDQFLQERLFGPLGMQETGYLPDSSLLSRIAATELDTVWRGQLVLGRVHDENADAMGGVAGHAGLFSTALDLSVFARMMLNGGIGPACLPGEEAGEPCPVARPSDVTLLEPSVQEVFTSRYDDTSSRALGWDTPSGRSSAGDYLTSRAYGHTGYTGTSLWIDPELDLWVVLLTNRVHPTRENQKHVPLRRAVHDAAVLAITDRSIQQRQP